MKNTTFRRLDLFPSSGEGRHLLCWVPNLNHWTLCFSLLFRKNPDDGQSPKTQYLCVLYTIVIMKVIIYEEQFEFLLAILM
jgi:hypothetical protein